VFEKTRDLVPGVFEFDAVMELIANRCNKIIVIFSDNLFQNDSINSFLVSFAQSVGIGNFSIKAVKNITKSLIVQKQIEEK
jgi:succinyl-CoA synthetase alpha subunit